MDNLLPDATYIANRLKTHPTIAEIAGDRVLDLDYRTAGWNTAPVDVFNADGVFLATLVVDDAGSVSRVATPIDAEEHIIYVWAFHRRTAQGMQDVKRLLRATKESLHRWQIPETKGMLIWSGSLGGVTADDGYFDRFEFRLSGIPRGSIIGENTHG